MKSLYGKENMMNFPVLNKYELMWMMVLFDLPVVEKKERKDATDFRKFLLDCGFDMVQYSIYIKVLSSTDACTKYYNLIERKLPEKGKVDILSITDRQYENIKSFNNQSKIKKKSMQQQLLMF